MQGFLGFFLLQEIRSFGYAVFQEQLSLAVLSVPRKELDKNGEHRTPWTKTISQPAKVAFCNSRIPTSVYRMFLKGI